jgi:hypothetical protein
VFLFSLRVSSEIFLILRIRRREEEEEEEGEGEEKEEKEEEEARYDQKHILVFMYNTGYFCPILTKLKLSRQIFEE